VGLHVPGVQAAEYVTHPVIDRPREDQVEKDLPHDLVAGIAEYRFRSVVPVEDAVVRVEPDVRERQPVDGQAAVVGQSVPSSLFYPWAHSASRAKKGAPELFLGPVLVIQDALAATMCGRSPSDLYEVDEVGGQVNVTSLEGQG
jgi:hypothetical protein